MSLDVGGHHTHPEPPSGNGPGDTGDLHCGSDDDGAPLPRFDGYQVLERLGEGSFGVVYRARQLRGHQLVAIKVPKDNEEAISLFESELTLLETLPGHPNVVRVIAPARADFGSGRSRPALVMAWIPNARPLDAYCEHLRLARPARVALLVQVATGLRHLHDHAVLHLDLKPRNILVGDDGVPVIVDLGGARCRIRGEAPPSVMTLTYASPEQLDSAEPESLDQRSDVYSFGRLAGAILLGGQVNVPPKGTSARDVLQRMREWRREEYCQHPRWPDDALGQLLLRMLDRDRNRRPSIQEVMPLLAAHGRPAALRLGFALRSLVAEPSLRGAVTLTLAAAIGIAGAIFLSAQYARHPLGPPLRFPARDVPALDDVVIVAIDEPGAVERAAAPLSGAITPPNVFNRRRHLIGETIRTASRGGASVVAVDAMLPVNPDAPSGTQDIAAAIREAGPNTVVVTGGNGLWVSEPTDWVLDPILLPEVAGVGCFDYLTSKDFDEAAHTPDGSDASVNGRAPDNLVHIPVLLDRPGRAMALSFSAAAVKAHLGGDIRMRHPLTPLTSAAIEFLPSWSRKQSVDRICELELSFVVGEPGAPTLSAGAKPGDNAYLLTFRGLQLEAACAEREIQVDAFLALRDLELRHLVKDKIVVLWIGEDGADRHQIAGRTIHGGWIQAAAIQSLLSMRPPVPSAGVVATLLILSAICAGGIGLRAGRTAFLRPWRGLLILVVADLLVIASLFALFPVSAEGAWDFRFLVLALTFVLTSLLAAIAHVVSVASRLVAAR